MHKNIIAQSFNQFRDKLSQKNSPFRRVNDEEYLNGLHPHLADNSFEAKVIKKNPKFQEETTGHSL